MFSYNYVYHGIWISIYSFLCIIYPDEETVTSSNVEDNICSDKCVPEADISWKVTLCTFK